MLYGDFLDFILCNLMYDPRLAPGVLYQHFMFPVVLLLHVYFFKLYYYNFQGDGSA